MNRGKYYALRDGGVELRVGLCPGVAEFWGSGRWEKKENTI